MSAVYSKRLKYLVTMAIVVAVILFAFNMYLTFFIHNKLAKAASKPGRWPVGAYVYDPDIGFDFAPGISGKIRDGSFYVKSHQLGYRISENDDADSYSPSGVLSLGCSFTYGDEVESYQTFTQFLADSLGLPAYNYGICSFSYIHALLKAEKLKKQGILDKLKPKYIILGCWNGLTARSRSPFPPLASRGMSIPAAHISREAAGELSIRYPLKAESVFALLESYRMEGTNLNLKRFIKIFTSGPRYIILYLKYNRLSQKVKSRTFQNDVSDYEVYNFYFSGIENIFSAYNSRIIVLFMPGKQGDSPGTGLKKAIANHPDLIFVDGMKAIQKYQVPVSEFQGTHPQPLAHLAYTRDILQAIRSGN